MRILKTKWFQRFVRRQGISDDVLREEVARVAAGHVDADLGGHLLKQRMSRSGQGRSAGFRVLVIYRKASRAIFVYGFAKSDKDALTADELAAYKMAAADYLAISDTQLTALVANGVLLEVDPDDQAPQE